MAIFKLEGELVKKISRQSLPNEKYLQKLVERNLDELFGIRFVETEYPIPNGRIDTLGLDESNTPVVIEYKNKQDLGAVIQGLFYVDWIRKNRRTFEMLVREKLGREAVVDWALSPRLIIVAEAFDLKEISAINQVRANVELKKHSFYGDMLSVEDVTVGRVSQKAEKPSGKETERDEDTIPTLEQQLERGSAIVRETFLLLRDKIFGFGDDVEERLTRKMICYYSGGKGMAWFDLSGKRLIIRLRKGSYSDEKERLKPGLGEYPEIVVKETEIDNRFVDYMADLLLQAYQN